MRFIIPLQLSTSTCVQHFASIGDQSPPSAGGTVHRPCTGGPVAALDWRSVPRQRMVRGPALTSPRPSPHSRAAQPSLLSMSLRAQNRPASTLLREHGAPWARCVASSLPREPLSRERAASSTCGSATCCSVSTRLRGRVAARVRLPAVALARRMLLREYVPPHANCDYAAVRALSSASLLFLEHAAPRARCSTGTLLRGHAAPRASSSASTLFREHAAFESTRLGNVAQ